MESATFVLRFSNTRNVIPVTPGQSLVVGRGPGVADVQLPNIAVSRRHFRLTNMGGRLVVEDLFSRGGTFINGIRIRGGNSLEAAPRR
jgi:pSer/pThr/pTyr-binding forkhead associated (FHA) protein